MANYCTKPGIMYVMAPNIVCTYVSFISCPFLSRKSGVYVCELHIVSFPLKKKRLELVKSELFAIRMPLLFVLRCKALFINLTKIHLEEARLPI